ncbi:MAG TPA: hypothetical protein VG347_02785, partial [Verrucomicrobiae bacterium]|nr:hypothetical protein [Verrucomicrobiae bacterium]
RAANDHAVVPAPSAAPSAVGRASDVINLGMATSISKSSNHEIPKGIKIKPDKTEGICSLGMADYMHQHPRPGNLKVELQLIEFSLVRPFFMRENLCGRDGGRRSHLG